MSLVTFTGSFVAGPAAQTWASLPPPDAGHTRNLTPAEMQRIVGGQSPGGISYYSGTPYGWEGNVGGSNTADGNKMIEVPIVSWTARGGLPVDLSLSYSSQSG